MTARVTELIKDLDALEQLIEEHRLMKESIEYSPHPYCVYDREDRLIAWNRAYTQTHPELGAAIEKAKTAGPVTYGQLMRTVLRGQVPDDQLEEAVTRRVASQRRSDGTPVERYYPEHGWLRITKYPTPSGAIAGIAIDITELKERERELRRAREVAEESERLRAEFLANMSHEIRTPMNGVLGMAELLRHTELDDRQRLFAETIVRSGQDLLRIINDVLDFAKIEAGGLDLDPQPFDPTEAVEDVATLLSGKVAEKGLELAVQFVAPMPKSVIGDGPRFRQILTNLVGNAIKFTQSGHILVRVLPTLCSRNGASRTVDLRVEVEDTGIGIPADRQQEIFEKFKQAETQEQRRHEGTGLGLAISTALVTLMGGEIGVDSAEDEGSTFWFRLELPIDANGAEPSTGSGPDLSGARVLIVDDNGINRTILTEQMTAWNYVPVVTATGPQALAIIADARDRGPPIDLVIIDHQMPDMPGEELLRQIRLLPGCRGIPVVLLTSIDAPDATKRLAHLGLSACLTKPARSAQLYETITAAMAKGRAGG